MIRLTPTERLEWLLEQRWLKAAHEPIKALLRQYRSFLRATNRSENTLLTRVLNDENYERYTASASKFGDSMALALNAIGSRNDFHRMLIV
jgi:hypothetical protein